MCASNSSVVSYEVLQNCGMLIFVRIPTFLVNLSFFFRSRLSYEQFAAFLANIKELNAHQQSRDVSFITNLLILRITLAILFYWLTVRVSLGLLPLFNFVHNSILLNKGKPRKFLNIRKVMNFGNKSAVIPFL